MILCVGFIVNIGIIYKYFLDLYMFCLFFFWNDDVFFIVRYFLWIFLCYYEFVFWINLIKCIEVVLLVVIEVFMVLLRVFIKCVDECGRGNLGRVCCKGSNGRNGVVYC